MAKKKHKQRKGSKSKGEETYFRQDGDLKGTL